MRNLIFKQLYYSDENYRLLESLMIPYNKELDEHENRCTSIEVLKSVTESMLKLQGAKDRHLELCFSGTDLIGFFHCKVDHSDDRGYKKVGYGYIMEFYVKPAYRLKGYGRAMFNRIEEIFITENISNMYLTADSVTGEPFWRKMGFDFYGDISPENNLKILEKEL